MVLRHGIKLEERGPWSPLVLVPSLHTLPSYHSLHKAVRQTARPSGRVSQRPFLMTPGDVFLPTPAA